MAKQRHTVEQIISKLTKAEVELSQGRSTGEVCRSLGVTEQTYYRWRKEFGGLKMDQAKRLKEVEQENTRLRRANHAWLRCDSGRNEFWTRGPVKVERTTYRAVKVTRFAPSSPGMRSQSRWFWAGR